jgi:hypothetical protein
MFSREKIYLAGIAEQSLDLLKMARPTTDRDFNGEFCLALELPVAIKIS